MDDAVQEETTGSSTVNILLPPLPLRGRHHQRLADRFVFGRIGIERTRTQRVLRKFMQVTFQAMIFPTIATIVTFIVRAARFTGVSDFLGIALIRRNPSRRNVKTDTVSLAYMIWTE
jgi:hypothetical protein